jgi:hypothetical protein
LDSTRVTKWTRIGAVVIVAVPAVGIGVATLWQAAAEGAALSANQLFHLGSGLALLVLFCNFAVTISHSPAAWRALLLGASGFMVSVVAALAVELLGPLALLALIVLAAAWAIIIVSPVVRTRGACRTSAST